MKAGQHYSIKRIKQDKSQNIFIFIGYCAWYASTRENNIVKTMYKMPSIMIPGEWINDPGPEDFCEKMNLTATNKSTIFGPSRIYTLIVATR